jgi:hypothetical protein
VEDTVRAVLGWRREDYAEDDWDEESVERSRAHGRHAHRVIVPPQKVESLRKAFARPDRTVLIRESGDGDKKRLSLGDAVANVPLWAIKDMLRQRDSFSGRIVASACRRSVAKRSSMGSCNKAFLSQTVKVLTFIDHRPRADPCRRPSSPAGSPVTKRRRCLPN